MAIAGYCPKRKEAIEKAKAIKVAQRQTQTEIIRRSNISVIAPKVTGQWSRFMGRESISPGSTSPGSINPWSTSQKSTNSGFTGSGLTSLWSTGLKTVNQRSNNQNQPTVEEVDPFSEEKTPTQLKC
jgi:hypothetical protein